MHSSPSDGPRARRSDGSAGDADYVSIGTVYRDYRVADPRIAAFVHAALGHARKVLNIGAGTGSYKPTDRDVTPVEPSQTMRERRPTHLPVAIDACAERLPFGDGAFDAAMGTFTVHQWANLIMGLAEVRRVTRGPVVFLTCDPALLRTYWLYQVRTRGDRDGGVALSADVCSGGWIGRPNDRDAGPDSTRLHGRFQRRLLWPPGDAA